ncbi:MAG TPA: DUF2125 domain-containing protein [Xanthobacteraceae bacterium]|nr:DUF2125 domain-containing protein [Xanthobacteraceae bacterium]
MMPGESPLGTMRPPSQRMRAAATRPRRPRRRWPILVPVAIVILAAIAWGWLWYYAASIADRTMAGWIEREAAAGRIYSCGTQSIGGFPLGLTVRCTNAAAQIKSTVPPYDVKAGDVSFSAEIYRPTRLVGDIVGPLSLAEAGQPPMFSANWRRAEVGVTGVPPYPETAFANLDGPHLDQVGAAGNATWFQAKHADLYGRVLSGSPRNHPVIEATLHLVAATAPTLHPIFAAAVDLDADAVMSGFNDLLPKPWPERFREMQANGGSVEIKALRLAQGKAIIVVGAGKLALNEHGQLDGVMQVAIVGLDQLVPRLGLDEMLAQGIDRLSGTPGTAAQGLNALDQIIPGLGGALRNTANAGIVDNLKKMGQPTTVESQAAVVLPLRFADGGIYLGMLRVGDVPPLF